MATSRGPILIAGAGIGGLTAALALADKEVEIRIVEKADRLEEAGAGLQLSPNASRVLSGLGLGMDLAARAIAPESVSVMSGPRGVELVRLPLAPGSGDAPYWVIHRADLQAALAARVQSHPAITLRLGSEFAGYTCASDEVVCRIREGGTSHEERAAALIGADGIWSNVRRQLLPNASPVFSNLIAWRGTVEQPRPEDASSTVQLWMGSNAHMVTYPVSQGRRTNVVAFSPGGWRESGWSAPAEMVEVQAAFQPQHWSAPARAIIASVRQWRKWALFTLPQSIAWTEGRVALLGDAAHAMLPFAAQGAAMAIEDAAVLAASLADTPNDIPAGLSLYARRRQPRVKRVQNLARSNGRIYHLAGPAAWARDLGMAVLGGRRLLARQGWVYDWRP